MRGSPHGLPGSNNAGDLRNPAAQAFQRLPWSGTSRYRHYDMKTREIIIAVLFFIGGLGFRENDWVTESICGGLFGVGMLMLLFPPKHQGGKMGR